MGTQTVLYGRPGTLAMLLATGLTFGAASGAAEQIVVSTAGELQAALVQAQAGRQILLTPGDYAVSVPLAVPDGVSLHGAGVMPGSGQPGGFAPGTETRIYTDVPFAGDLLTLGDGVRLTGLIVEHAPGATGNTVAVISRAPGDVVSVSIDQCEIISPNQIGITPPGPIGEALLLITLNPNLGADPPAHNGTMIDLRLSRSIIRNSHSGGAAIFAINFSSSSRISLTLNDSVIGGSLRLSGGVSRPDAVSGSELLVQSQNNLYRPGAQGVTMAGWQLSGGSTVPIPLAAGETRNNAIDFTSRGDRIEGFQRAVLAAAGSRQNNLPGPASDNSIDLKLHGLVIATPNDGASADLILRGATSSLPLSPGDNNVLRAKIQGTTGSGYRNNVFADVTASSDQGTGNTLVIVGNATAFDRTNADVLPVPAAEFFIAVE